MAYISKENIKAYPKWVAKAAKNPFSKDTNNEPSWYYGLIYVGIALASTVMPFVFGWSKWPITFLFEFPDLLFSFVIMPWLVLRFGSKQKVHLDEYALRISKMGVYAIILLIFTPFIIKFFQIFHWTTFTFVGYTINNDLGAFIWFVFFYLIIQVLFAMSAGYHLFDLSSKASDSQMQKMLWAGFAVLVYDLVDILLLIILNP